jgi:ATP-dependent Clp protease ATP-binding subunit ClpC
LVLTTAAKERLIELGYEPSLGARPLRRTVQREIEDEISERILTGDIQSAQDIKVDFVSDAFTFETTSREAEAVKK